MGRNPHTCCPLDNQKMAILDARDKLDDARILDGQFIVQVFDEHVCVLGFEIATIVRDDDAVVHIDDVATKGKVIGCHLIADACSLKVRPSYTSFWS